MTPDVRRLVCKLALFLIPSVAYAGVIVAVDPYNMFTASGPVDNQLKVATSCKLNFALWKIVAFRRNPAPHIVLGDSRVMGLDAESIGARTGTPVANLAYGGGSLREAIDTFWLAEGETELERVSFGISFNNYNAANDKDRVSEVRSILDNPLLYFTNLNVIDACGRILCSLATGRVPQIGEPPMSPDAFWRHQIEVTTRIQYQSWRSPDRYREELAEIADYCRDHDIQLEFIIPPGHVEVRQAIEENELVEEYAAFKADLAKLALVHDFDEVNDFTANRANFKDPYHLQVESRLELIEGVWGGGSNFVKRYGTGGRLAAAARLPKRSAPRGAGDALPTL